MMVMMIRVMMFMMMMIRLMVRRMKIGIISKVITFDDDVDAIEKDDGDDKGF